MFGVHDLLLVVGFKINKIKNKIMHLSTAI